MSTITERAGIKRRPRTKADFDWIGRSIAENELAQAFNLPREVASMLLHGLIATGNVRALGNDNELIDIDACTIADLEGKAASVAANELRDWINEHSTVPQGRQSRDGLIAQKLREGINPPRNISWKEFRNDIRNGCGGWIVTGGKRHAAHGFGDKQIQRAVNRLRSI
jgi:hypothetical protein